MPTDKASLDVGRHGATRHHRAALPVLNDLEQVLAPVALGHAGTRLHGLTGLAPLLADTSAIGHMAALRLGAGTRPVRAVLFDKSPDTNWTLGWHQDRTVAVAARHELPAGARGPSRPVFNMSSRRSR